MHTPSQLELIGGNAPPATGEAASRTISPTTASVGPAARAPPATTGAATAALVAEASAMPVIGVVDAATASRMQIRLNARATAEQRLRRDKRATFAPTVGFMRET